MKHFDEKIPEYWNNLSLENIIYTDNEGKECIEEWRDIIGYEGLYKISDLGRVKSLHNSPKILKQFINYKEYLRVSLTGENKKLKTISVHILVGNSFIQNINKKPQINHINGIKRFNCVWNLEWNTNGENGRHARRMGLCKQIAETASSAKLTNIQVLEIFNSDLSQSVLRKKYNASDCTISNIKTGRKWSSITGKIFNPKKMNKDKVLDIFNSTLPIKEIKEKFGVNIWTVNEIRSGKRWGSTTGKIHKKINSL